MHVCRKTYTVTVTIAEGSDEFWEGLRGRSGADDVVKAVEIALAEHGFQKPDTDVRLARFEER